MYEHFFRRCLKAYGSQSHLENHMTRYIERELCDISCMNADENININDWCMKINPPM